ncbi:hypothetical protein Ccrd_024633 [Cynara cardunculus var. scolymus]|uniref:Uncharacterized protein n=1 Tax=Cynara cardunculus var. scolymus TaxID=59895 RepID=A0A103XC35_CYNCS|nr:hypothetical protein Ccrd_024633 [Cynara cardunculus var. scolymus]
MKKTYFSNFKNTIDNPVDVDEDSEVGRTNEVQINEGCSSKGKCLEIQQSTVTKPIVLQTSKQAARVGKVPEIQLPQDSDLVMLLDVNVQIEVKASNDVMGAPRKPRNEQAKEDTVEHTDVQGYSLGIRTRTSPKALWETVKALNSNQRAAIKEMRFDALLDMTLDGIPSKLGHYVVDMLDTSTMTIQLRDGQIPVTVKSIHDVLGLPTGGLDLNLVGPSKRNDAVVSAWRKQFSKDRMSPNDVMNVIQQSDDAGVMFKMRFLVIMLNTLAECSRVGVCNLGFLKRIHSLDMIPRIDWCKYMLYVQSTTCDGIQNQQQRYPLRTWTLDLLRRRQDVELSRGGWIHKIDILWMVLQECVIMMGERIADLFSARREADTMLQAYIDRFPGERCFDQFKQELARMFKDSMWECLNDEGQPREKDLPTVHVTPTKMTTTSDPAMLSPLSQFWTSPTVIAEVDQASNERAAITTKGVGCNTDPKQFERVNMTSLEAPLESVGRVRGRGIDECEPRTSKLRRRAQTEIEAPAFDLGISPSKEAVIACIDSSKATAGQENVRSEITKRDPKLSFKLRSPYVTRAVTFEVSSDERKLQDWILRGVGGIL